VAATTAERINAGDSAADAVAFAMKTHRVSEKSREEVGRAVVQSLCVGNGIWPKVTADMMPTLQKTALAGIWDDSDLTLSQRLHGTDAAMRSDVVSAINAHLEARNDTWTASRRIYDGYGFGGALKTAKLDQLPADLRRLEQSARKVLTPDAMAQLQLDAKRLSAYADRLATAPLKAAYKQMAAKLEDGLTKGLDRLVQTAMDEKARYHASRILRTESARAWGQGFQAQCDDDPDVVGWRWETSGAHKIFDICDFHARADLFGMGPGIYPKDRHPSYPAHPHCLCQASMVFKGETPDPRPNVQGGGKAALDGMTGAQRARLLAVKGSQGYNGNGQWQDNLRHWTGAGPAKLSAGARAVLMGVKQWQPDFQLVPKANVPVLTAPEKKAIVDYSKTGYVDLNNALWAGSKDPKVVSQAALLASALDKMPQVSGTLYRGIQGGIKEVSKILAESPEGAEVTWLGFTSTTTDEDYADYHRDHSGIMVYIHDGKGADISGVSDKPNESEVLIKHGTRFKVLKSLRSKDGTRTLIVRQL
jgi:hypothetical protein